MLHNSIELENEIVALNLIREKIESMPKFNQVEVLKALKEEVLFNYELPNRQFLVDEIDRKINKVNFYSGDYFK